MQKRQGWGSVTGSQAGFSTCAMSESSQEPATSWRMQEGKERREVGSGQLGLKRVGGRVRQEPACNGWGPPAAIRTGFSASPRPWASLLHHLSLPSQPPCPEEGGPSLTQDACQPETLGREP